jgi:hypothetical protein
VIAAALALTLALGAAPLAQVDAGGEDEIYEDDRRRAKVRLSAVGGSLLNRSGEGSDWVTLAGGQIAWVRDSADIGLLVQGYRGLQDREPDTWSPVVLARIEQRFLSRRGVDGTLALGLGAARPDGWRAWYLFALGARLPLGPAHLGAEIGFEQSFLVRFAASLGVAF